MNIREIVETDIREYAALYVSVFNSKPWNESWSDKTALARLDFYRRTPNFIGLSAHDGSELIGFVFGNFEPYQQGSIYLLKEMCVQPNHQRTGVGTKLLKQLHSVLTEHKINLVNLITRADQPAEAFYLKNGYAKTSHMGLYVARLNI